MIRHILALAAIVSAIESPAQAQANKTAGRQEGTEPPEVRELREVVVKATRRRMLHILAYVRENSLMTNCDDTVRLFREKTVDFMLPWDADSRERVWLSPRVLASRSCYRFTDGDGLDSVSDEGQHHFSWSDWVGVAPKSALPSALRKSQTASDTLRGRYSPAEIWARKGDTVSVRVDLLAGAEAKKWTPGAEWFFRRGVDFEKFRIAWRYTAADDTLSALDLDGYSFIVESNGRGHEMFGFAGSPFIRTEAEVYVIDREVISAKEARKWEKLRLDTDGMPVIAPPQAPPLSEATLALIDKVNGIDREAVRLDKEPDMKLYGGLPRHDNFSLGRRALLVLKDYLGISGHKFHKKFNRNWEAMRRSLVKTTRPKPHGDTIRAGKGAPAGQNGGADAPSRPSQGTHERTEKGGETGAEKAKTEDIFCNPE